MPSRETFDHTTNHCFIVEVSGLSPASFAEVSGLEISCDVIEYRNGDEYHTRKRPGKVSYANVILRRGVIGDQDWWDWQKAVFNGQVDPRECQIKVLDSSRHLIYTYRLRGVWPCRWKGVHLTAGRPQTLVEEIELAVETIEMK